MGERCVAVNLQVSSTPPGVGQAHPPHRRVLSNPPVPLRAVTGLARAGTTVDEERRLHPNILPRLRTGAKGSVATSRPTCSDLAGSRDVRQPDADSGRRTWRCRRAGNLPCCTIAHDPLGAADTASRHSRFRGGPLSARLTYGESARVDECPRRPPTKAKLEAELRPSAEDLRWRARSDRRTSGGRLLLPIGPGAAMRRCALAEGAEALCEGRGAGIYTTRTGRPEVLPKPDRGGVRRDHRARGRRRRRAGVPLVQIG